MIIKIYPDLRWEITDLKWIDPSNYWDQKRPYSEYDVVREFDDVDYTDRTSNVIFLIKKSSSIKKALGGYRPVSKIDWIVINTDFYRRWFGVPSHKDTITIHNRELILMSKCPIPKKDIERCIISAERSNKIDQLLNKKYED